MEVDADIQKRFVRNSSKDSMIRSLSRGSSGSRPSFSLSFGIPGVVNMIETDTEFDDDETTESDQRRHQTNSNKASFRRLAYLNKPELTILLIGSIAAVAHGTIFPLFGLLLSSSINMFYKPPDQLRKDSNFWALIYLSLGVMTLVALPIQNYLFGIAGGKLIKRIRYLSFQKIVHQQISYFDDPANSRYDTPI